AVWARGCCVSRWPPCAGRSGSAPRRPRRTSGRETVRPRRRRVWCVARRRPAAFLRADRGATIADQATTAPPARRPAPCRAEAPARRPPRLGTPVLWLAPLEGVPVLVPGAPSA